MAIKGLKKVINNLTNIKKSANDIDRLFIQLSLEWIKNRANEILDSDLSYAPNTFGTNIREWDIIINNHSGRLENKYENSAGVEFGVGVVGEMNPTIHAQNSHWQYNTSYGEKDDEGAWSFYDQNGKFWYKFTGYKGKSFLYKALMEYKDYKIWYILYQQAFDTIMRKVIR